MSVTIEFLTEIVPDALVGDILDIYRLQGWWGAGSDKDASNLRALIRGSHCFVAAIENGRAVGIGRALSDRASDAYIQDVAVLPSLRRQGIGSRIVEAISERLREDGIEWVGLVAESGTPPFYERIGFSQMMGTVLMLNKKRM